MSWYFPPLSWSNLWLKLSRPSNNFFNTIRDKMKAILKRKCQGAVWKKFFSIIKLSPISAALISSIYFSFANHLEKKKLQAWTYLHQINRKCNLCGLTHMQFLYIRRNNLLKAGWDCSLPKGYLDSSLNMLYP